VPDDIARKVIYRGRLNAFPYDKIIFIGIGIYPAPIYSEK
jgi:hypothetical protein